MDRQFPYLHFIGEMLDTLPATHVTGRQHGKRSIGLCKWTGAGIAQRLLHQSLGITALAEIAAVRESVTDPGWRTGSFSDAFWRFQSLVAGLRWHQFGIALRSELISFDLAGVSRLFRCATGSTISFRYVEQKLV